MLVCLLHPHGRGAMDAALVGEGAGPDVRRVGIGGDVGDLGDEVRQLGEMRKVAARRARSGIPSLSARLAQIVTRLALPQRSP